MTRARPSRRRVAATSLVALIAATGLASPAAADSGQALVEIGRFSNGTSTGIDPASLLSGLTHNQGAGGNFGVSAGPRFTTNAFTYVPPADTSIAASSARVTDLYAYGWPAMSTWTEVITSWGSWNVDGNPGEVAMSGVVSGGAASTISAGVRQASHGAGTEQAGRLYLDRLAITLTDLHPPRIDASPGAGTLFGVPNSSGWYTAATLPVTVSASDRGLGVRRLVLRDSHGNVHATALTALPPTCVTRDPDPTLFGGDTYTASVPCPTAVRQYVVPIDMTRLGDGQHDLQLGIQDASGRIAYEPTTYPVRVNAPGDNAGPGGTAGLPDPGTPCTNGSYDDAGTCIVRPPSNSGAPVISGTARAGQMLTASTGTWADIDAVSWSYQWQLCSAAGNACTGISGSNGATLTLTDAMAGYTVRAVVTATTSGGTATASTAPSAQIRLASGTMPGGGGTGGAGAVRDAAVRAGAGGGGGGATAERVDDLPVPGPITQYVGILNGKNASEHARLTVDQRASQAITGLLASAAGTPIGDAQIDIVLQESRTGGRSRIGGAVRTNGDGTFRYVPPAGAWPHVTFGYRVSLSDDHYDAIVSTTISAPIPITLNVSKAKIRNGQTVRFSGAATGLTAGTAETAALQVRLGRSTWRTIANMPLTRSGGFSYTYRFERTRHTQAYTFRAVAAPHPGSAYAASASNAVSVTVRSAASFESAAR